MRNRKKVNLNKRAIRPYQQLEGDWQDTEKYNAYECDTCSGIYVTVDVNEGVTPMMSQCFAKEGCAGRAKSLGYPSGGSKPPARLGPVVLEWFRPVNLGSYSFEMQEYLRKGGLARRAAPTAPAWVKRIA